METGTIEISSITNIIPKKREHHKTFEFDIVTNSRSYHLRANDEDSRNYWMSGLRKFCKLPEDAPKIEVNVTSDDEKMEKKEPNEHVDEEENVSNDKHDVKHSEEKEDMQTKEADKKHDESTKKGKGGFLG